MPDTLVESPYGEVQNIPLKRYLIDHPIAGETILFTEPVRYSSSIWGDEEYDGICFISDKRCGLINNTLNSSFTFCEYIFYYRAIAVEDNQLYLRWINRNADFTDKNNDYFIVIKMVNNDKVEEVYWNLTEIHYNNVSPNVIPDLESAYTKIKEGQFDFALNILTRLSKAYDSSIIDLMIARTLKYMGRGYEAASFVAKNFMIASMLAPASVFSEYLLYDWHIGALRLLPDINSLSDNEGNKVSKIILKLVTALEKRSELEIATYLNELCLSSDSGNRLMLPIILYANYKNINILKSSIEKILKIYKNVFEESSSKLTKKEIYFIEYFIYLFQYIIEPKQYNYLRLIEYNYEEQPLEYFLGNENYSAILNLNYEEKLVSTPTVWQLEAISEDAWDVGSKKDRFEFEIKKLFAQSRFEDIPNYHEKCNELKNRFSMCTLNVLDPSITLLFCILQIEVAIKKGDNQKALSLIRDWKRDNREFIGSLHDPLLRHSEAIMLLYEAWVFKSQIQIKDALEKIPAEKPLLWVNELGKKILENIESERNAPANAKEATERLNNLVSVMMSIHSKNLSQEIKGNIMNYVQEISNGIKIIENCDKTKYSTTINEKNNENSLLGKTIKFIKNITLTNRIDEIELEKYKWQVIKVALAGETSAGKTTFLNSVFSTNIFFVTQEEATGVPTEIRYGSSMRIDALDKAGKIKQQLKVNDNWLSPDRSYIQKQYIDKIKTFMAKYTSVNSSELNWVDRVVVYMPLVRLPESVILIDTPGYNATEIRSQIAAKIISASNVCLFIIDARNALKGKELDVLETIRQEVGKTFLILNKMDLVLGDDELDCDGADAADQTIDRVRKDLLRKLDIEQIQLYPICSLNKDQVLDDARRYVMNVDVLKNNIFDEILEQHFDLLIDSLAKETITLSASVINSVDKAINDYQEEKLKLERYIPKDPRMFEEEINERLHQKLINSRNIFIENINASLNLHFKQLYDSFAYWVFREVNSANKLKDEVKSRAENYISLTISQIESDRNKEIERIIISIGEELIAIFEELYSQLPFEASFETNSIVRDISNIQGIMVSNDFGSINYSDDSLIAGGIGSGIGMAIGALILGPLGIFLGSIAGGFLGSLFGKSLDDIKKEVYDLFCKGVEELWNKITTTIDKDLGDDNISSFNSKISVVVTQQVEVYKNVINYEIKKHEEKGQQLQDQMDNLKFMAIQVQDFIEDLKLWRNKRRNISA